MKGKRSSRQVAFHGPRSLSGEYFEPTARLPCPWYLKPRLLVAVGPEGLLKPRLLVAVISAGGPGGPLSLPLLPAVIAPMMIWTQAIVTREPAPGEEVALPGT